MESNTLSNLKDLSVGSKTHNSSNKMKDSWSYNSQTYGEDSYLGGFSWPPRSYTCSFCKREFRSAQALGGHMNVHRRDRARLRQSPPRDSHHHCPPLNLNLSPNPNFSTCTLPTSLASPPLFATSSPSFVSHTGEIKKWQVGGNLHANSGPQGCLGLKNMESRQSLLAPTGFDHDFMNRKHGCKLLKKAKILSLDLEIGSLVSDPKEDLDLELRLGYS